jgi:transposase
MRPSGTEQQLAARRKRALALLRQGKSPTETARAVGASARSVQRWQQAARAGGSRRKQNTAQPGRPGRLSVRQLKQLERTLQKGARAQGYAEDYWTLARIAQVIRKLFGVRYQPSGVWHVLRRMGWSCQKPQRVAFQHDDKVVAHWKRYIWPWIKKVA